jgi:hypothetical protein
MSREEEFVGSLTHYSSFSIYFMLFIIIKVCSVLFIKFVKTLIKNRKVENRIFFSRQKHSSLSLCSLICEYCSTRTLTVHCQYRDPLWIADCFLCDVYCPV